MDELPLEQSHLNHCHTTGQRHMNTLRATLTDFSVNTGSCFRDFSQHKVVKIGSDLADSYTIRKTSLDFQL